MGFMKKIAVGRQTGGFMQTRRGTRPLRVDTLLNKEVSVPDSHKDFWIETSAIESEAPDIFAEGLAHTEGEEFGAEPQPKIAPELSRIAKEAASSSKGPSLGTILAKQVIPDVIPDIAIIVARKRKNKNKQVGNSIKPHSIKKQGQAASFGPSADKLRAELRKIKNRVESGNQHRQPEMLDDAWMYEY